MSFFNNVLGKLGVYKVFLGMYSSPDASSFRPPRLLRVPPFPCLGRRRLPRTHATALHERGTLHERGRPRALTRTHKVMFWATNSKVSLSVNRLSDCPHGIIIGTIHQWKLAKIVILKANSSNLFTSYFSLLKCKMLFFKCLIFLPQNK